MRVMLKANMSVEKANALVRAGKLGSTIQAVLDDLKPEAAYFTDEKGQRTGYVIVNIADASEIPKIAEPWFLALNAAVEMHVVMTPADLAKAAPHIEAAARKFS